MGKGDESRKLETKTSSVCFMTIQDSKGDRKMGDARSVVIITGRKSIARKATNFHAISTAYNAPYNTLSSG